MRFNHYDLGNQSRGNIVEVALSGNAANVRLLDSSNFRNYRSRRKHRYYGGLVQRSPARIAIPHSSHWHIIVNMKVLRGTTRSSIRIIPHGTNRSSWN